MSNIEKRIALLCVLSVAVCVAVAVPQRTIADEIRGLVYYHDATGLSTRIEPIAAINASAGKIDAARVDVVGIGDVTGPADSVDGAIAIYGGTTGKTLDTCRENNPTIDKSSGKITIPGGVTSPGLWGAYNEFVGDGCGVGVFGDNNVAMGKDAYAESNGSENVAIGSGAMRNATSGGINVVVGSACVTSAFSGDFMVVVGGSGMQSITSGEASVAIGASVMPAAEYSGDDVAIGYQALASATTSIGNTVIGAYAAESRTGLLAGSICVGQSAGRYAADDYMIFINSIDRGDANGDLHGSPVVVYQSSDTAAQWTDINGELRNNGTAIASLYAPYNHTQSATTITQDLDHRFVSDLDTTRWNAKQDALTSGGTGVAVLDGTKVRALNGGANIAVTTEGDSNRIAITGEIPAANIGTHNNAWSTITSTPTTLSGYGISDAQPSLSSGGTGTAILDGTKIRSLNSGTNITVSTAGDSIRADLSGVVPLASGGTGASTAAAARTALNVYPVVSGANITATTAADSTRVSLSGGITSAQIDGIDWDKIDFYGTANTFLGELSGNRTISGDGSNTGIGYAALRYNTTGHSNTAIGSGSQASNTTGYLKTSVGYGAIGTDTDASYLSGFGYYAGHYETESNLIYIDGVDRGSLAGDRTGAPIRIEINSNVNAQHVGFNSNDIKHNGTVVMTNGVLANGSLPTGGDWALSSNLSIDSPTVYVDKTNNKVGIGTASPLNVFHAVVPYAKTDTTERELMFLSSNETLANKPFGLAVSIKGHATDLASRTAYLSTAQQGEAYGGNLCLQANSGKVGIGTTAPDAELSVNGYMQMGIGVDSTTSYHPKIKTKVIKGTTSSSASGSVYLPHGLASPEKTIGISGCVRYTSGVGGYAPGTAYDIQISATNAVVTNKDASVVSCPFSVLITYEE